MKCRHTGTRETGRFVVMHDGSNDRVVDTDRCLDCGAWLSLGPSDEGPVAVEVRAAEIAAHESIAHAWLIGGVSDCERDGFEMRGDDEPSCPAEESGYLARCIVEGE